MSSLGTSFGRHWHILRPTSGESVPDRVLVFQVAPLIRWIDSKSTEHSWGGGAGATYHLVDGRVESAAPATFQTREDWYAWIAANRRRDRCTWIYSYGLTYGLTLLNWWRMAERAGERILFAVLSDPPSIVSTRRGRYVSKYVDIANYIRDGLAGLRRDCGAEGPPASQGQSLGVPDLDACRNRVRLVGEFVCRAIGLVRAHRLCAWQPSAASLSFATLRHSFLDAGIAIHGDQQATELERACLFGGRVQMWRSGQVDQPVTILDFNSLYPYVMAHWPLPIKLRRYSDEETPKSLRQALQGYECVAAVRLGPTQLAYPLRGPGHSVWSGAAGVYYLGGAELRQASGERLIRRVLALARYDAGMPLESFARALFRLKCSLADQGDLAGATFVKLVANSIVGKFSQKGRKWVHYEEIHARGKWCTWWGRHPVDGTFCLHRCLGGHPECLETGHEWQHSLPGLSAAITAAGRIELSRHLAIAGTDQALYCDTDSIHSLPVGYRRLVAADAIHPTAWGKLKILHKGEDAYYWGLKHYRVGTKFVCAGLTASAWSVADGVYLDAARRGFSRLLADGLPTTQTYSYHTVYRGDRGRTAHLPLVEYGEVL